MRHPVQSIIRHLLRGITWGCTFFVFFCFLVLFLQGKAFLLSILEYFPKHALGTILVGIGYGSTPIVYKLERPSLLLKAALHFFIGTGTFFFVAFRLAWIPLRSGRDILLELLISCVTFAIIWTGFYLFGCKEAKEINRRLQELTERDSESL